jgi:hypothetical protein
MHEDYPDSNGHDLPVSAVGRSPASARDRMPWRPVSVGAIGIGTPLGAAALHPEFGEIVAIIELFVMLAVIGTALFGSQALSERAFRLLRWFANKPEPKAPAASADGSVGRI